MLFLVTTYQRKKFQNEKNKQKTKLKRKQKKKQTDIEKVRKYTVNGSRISNKNIHVCVIEFIYTLHRLPIWPSPP
jgi:hypothetical protein